MNTNQKAGGGWGREHKRKGTMRERGKERSVCCALAEHLLSLETTAHPGGNELFLLDHDIEHQCPENVCDSTHLISLLVSCSRSLIYVGERGELIYVFLFKISAL